jgi:hypothetical protein
MTLIGDKGLLTSKTVWGGIISALPAIGKILEVTGVIPPGIVDASTALITSTLGGILSIYGRITATKQITSIL